MVLWNPTNSKIFRKMAYATTKKSVMKMLDNGV